MLQLRVDGLSGYGARDAGSNGRFYGAGWYEEVIEEPSSVHLFAGIERIRNLLRLWSFVPMILSIVHDFLGVLLVEINFKNLFL